MVELVANRQGELVTPQIKSVLLPIAPKHAPIQHLQFEEPSIFTVSENIAAVINPARTMDLSWDFWLGRLRICFPR